MVLYLSRWVDSKLGESRPFMSVALLAEVFHCHTDYIDVLADDVIGSMPAEEWLVWVRVP